MANARLLHMVPLIGSSPLPGSSSRAGTTPPGARPNPLDQVREAIRVRHYSERTEEAYVGWIKRFIMFHGKRHPAEMGRAEVSAFLSLLATRAHVSSSTENEALNARLFL
jgi:hypothetical protein